MALWLSLKCSRKLPKPHSGDSHQLDPEELKKKYGRGIVFLVGIGENEIPACAGEEEVRKETRRSIDIFGGHYNYIAAASHDYRLPEIPARNIVAMFDKVKKYGIGRMV